MLRNIVWLAICILIIVDVSWLVRNTTTAVRDGAMRVEMSNA
jgi:hypothetical protein